MSAADDMRRITITIEQRAREVTERCAVVAHGEYKVGGPITGAPGQPVDTGNLRNSIQLEQLSPDAWRSSTNVVYAKPIEDGIGPHGPLTLRSTVGGFHSRALVVAGFPRILQHVLGTLGLSSGDASA